MNIPQDCLNMYTTQRQAEQINKIILSYVDSASTITDATACIGGNSVLFARDFSRVISVEKNHKIFKILESNLKQYSKTCTCYNSSYNNIKFIIKQDVVFIDPPWGGQDYKIKKDIKLFLDSTEIRTIVNDLYNFTTIIVLKVPINFDMNSLDTLFWSHRVYPIQKNGKTIYNIVLFHKHT